MSKALEILKQVSTECEAHENFMGYAYEANKVDKLIDRAIAELEDIKQRTCEGCKYEYSDELEKPCKNCKRNTPDFYAKDNS